MTDENKPLTGVTISGYCGACKNGGCEHVRKRMTQIESGDGPNKLVDRLEKMLCEMTAQLEASREAARYTAKCYAEEMARADRAEAMAAVAKAEIKGRGEIEADAQRTWMMLVDLYNGAKIIGSGMLGVQDVASILRLAEERALFLWVREDSG